MSISLLDWTDEVEALLPAQFQGDEWLALAGVFGDAFDRLEGALVGWYADLPLSEAEGDLLELFWAQLVGIEREGDDDDTLRIRVEVEAQVLRSNGTPDELLTIAATMVGGFPNLLYWETPPASYSIQHPNGVYIARPELALEIARNLARADPAGVSIGQIISAPTGSPFTFGTDGSKGFSEEGGTTYGLLCTDTATEAGV